MHRLPLLVVSALLTLGGTERCASADDAPATGAGGRIVRELDSPDAIHVSGTETWSAEEVESMIYLAPGFERVMHSRAPLRQFAEFCAHAVYETYRKHGFAQVGVDADVEGAHLEVRVREGTRTLAGEVVIRGAERVPAERLREALTAPRTPQGMPIVDAPADSERDTKAELPPVWTPGAGAPLHESVIDEVRRVIGAIYLTNGVSYSGSVRVDVVGSAATLEIDITEESPPARIRRVRFGGDRPDDEEAMLDFLDIRPGAVVSEENLERVRARLLGSGRYYHAEVSWMPLGRSDAADLSILLIENEDAAPLGSPASPARLALRRGVSWLNEPSRQEGSFGIEVRHAEPDADGALRTVVKVTGAIDPRGFEVALATADASDPVGTLEDIGRLFLADDRALLESSAQREYASIDAELPLAGRLDVTLGTNPRPPYRSLSLALGWKEGAPDVPPFAVAWSVNEAFLVSLFEDGLLADVEDERVRFRKDDPDSPPLFAVDRETGEIDVDTEFPISAGVSFRITRSTETVSSRLGTRLEELRSDAMWTPRPMAAVAASLLSRLGSTEALGISGLDSGFAREVLPVLLARWTRPDGPLRRAVGSFARRPRPGPERSRETRLWPLRDFDRTPPSTRNEFASTLLIHGADRLLLRSDLRGWPRDLLLEILYTQKGHSELTPLAVESACAAEDVGPLGYWLWAEALGVTGRLPDEVDRLVERARAESSRGSEGFSKDVRTIESLSDDILVDVGLLVRVAPGLGLWAETIDRDLLERLRAVETAALADVLRELRLETTREELRDVGARVLTDSALPFVWQTLAGPRLRVLAQRAGREEL